MDILLVLVAILVVCLLVSMCLRPKRYIRPRLPRRSQESFATIPYKLSRPSVEVPSDQITSSIPPLSSISAPTLSIPTESATAPGSVYIPTGLQYSFAGGDTSYFPRIITEQPVEPDQAEIIRQYRDCIASGQDTVKGCLTSSGAGFRPGICMKLCAEQYGDMNKYCTSVCVDQQTQVNTSARFGPA